MVLFQQLQILGHFKPNEGHVLSLLAAMRHARSRRQRRSPRERDVSQRLNARNLAQTEAGVISAGRYPLGRVKQPARR
jgi:hypothetical protein